MRHALATTAQRHNIIGWKWKVSVQYVRHGLSFISLPNPVKTVKVLFSRDVLRLHSDAVSYFNSSPGPASSLKTGTSLWWDFALAFRRLRTSHLFEALFSFVCFPTGALDKQRQMYEEKIEELRNQMGPRQNMERASSIGSFSSGYGSSRVSWMEDR